MRLHQVFLKYSIEIYPYLLFEADVVCVYDRSSVCCSKRLYKRLSVRYGRFMRFPFSNAGNHLKLICGGRVTIPKIYASVEPISVLSLNHSGMGVLLFYYYYLFTLISIGTREKVLSRIYAHVHVCIYVDV